MKNLMVVYETKYGQTRKIAERVADLARTGGWTVEVARVAEVRARDVETADAFIILAPVFLGHHMEPVRRFVTEQATLLATHPGAFFSVSGSAGSAHAADREAARTTATDFLAKAGWSASMVETFGGAIAYPKYSWITRLLMKRISKQQGRSIDTSKIDELTNWSAVDAATMRFLDLASESRFAAVA